MNGRERLEAIFANREIDRPALKLWGFCPGQPLIDEAYEPVYELAARTTDYMLTGSSEYDLHLGNAAPKLAETMTAPGPSPEWEDAETVWHTPMGDLKSVYRTSTKGLPGYELEHFVKTARDIEALMSVPYEPYPLDMAGFVESDGRAGERGLCMYGLGNAMYCLQMVMGPERFALMSIESRDLLHEAIGEYSRRILFEVKRVFDAGYKPVFSWVGPETCIPPLMSPHDFEEFVMRYDKPLCEYIHERGGHVWVHCHNKVGKFISRFIEMGVDVLNPLEPPPMGDVNLADVVAKHGNAIGLEGNIETHDLWSAEKGKIEDLVEAAVAEGAKSGRFILCPSAGYMEFTNPTERYIDNLMTYLNFGFKQVERCRR